MRIIFIYYLLFFVASLSAQQLQVCSSKDSLPVPFATIYIKNSFISFGKVADDKGKIIYRQAEEDDSTNYTLIIQAVGYDKYTRVVMGLELNKIKKIYITSSNLNLSEVVITAQYAPTTAEQAVQKIQIIDKEKIQQLICRKLMSIISNVLNLLKVHCLFSTVQMP